jgi:S-adenosylmethionine decarboxylase
MTMTFGTHLMIDGYAASPGLLSDRIHLTRLLLELPAELGMHAIAAPQVVEVGPMNPKDPGGISGFVMIAESHISFHTFPARGFVTIDLYTCQTGFDTGPVIVRLKAAFGLTDVDVHVQPRGLRYPEHDIAPRAA